MQVQRQGRTRRVPATRQRACGDFIDELAPARGVGLRIEGNWRTLGDKLVAAVRVQRASAQVNHTIRHTKQVRVLVQHGDGHCKTMVALRQSQHGVDSPFVAGNLSPTPQAIGGFFQVLALVV